MTKCHHCPLANEQRECLAVISRNSRYCSFMDPASSLYRPAYRAVLLAHPEVPAQPERPSVAESLRMVEAMKACPHRTAETGCGCGGMARCALGKGRGDGLVNHADCFACLQSGSAP
jgi:hypothetical protein